MPLDYDVLQGLMSDINKLAENFEPEGKVVKQALNAGAVPLEARIKSNVTSGDPDIITGALSSAIASSPVRKYKYGARKAVGVTRAAWRKAISSKRDGWKEDDYYPAYVEYGHGGPRPAPPHPYIRPAYDAEVETVYRIIRNTLESNM